MCINGKRAAVDQCHFSMEEREKILLALIDADKMALINADKMALINADKMVLINADKMTIINNTSTPKKLRINGKIAAVDQHC